MIQILFGTAIFTSAFLLFFIQPLLAKHLLPLFGGSAVVWIASMLFFQVGLLLGYAYAFLLTHYFSERYQAAIHLLFIIIAFSFFPIDISSAPPLDQTWGPLSIFQQLSNIILLPFIILCASSPLLQHWYCSQRHTPYPYYYYAISNAGSLLGLLGYPLLLEPLWGLQLQTQIWSVLYIIYIVLCLLCLSPLLRAQFSNQVATTTLSLRLSQITQWILFSSLSCAFLAAITYFLAQNVLNLPLIWILPLALYLISYIVTFARAQQYARSFWIMTFLIWLLITIGIILTHNLNGMNAVLVFLSLFYSACMICHGELIQRKPQSQADLTLFYLCIAVGGVLGSLATNMMIVSFVTWWEFYIPILIFNIIALVLCYRSHQHTQHLWDLGTFVLSLITLIAFIFLISVDLFALQEKRIAKYRSLYGILQVYDAKNNTYRALMHGTIMHGLEYQDPTRLLWPTTYYGPQSGAGLAMQFLRTTTAQPLKIGIIGLGTGTLAALAQPNEQITYYEIDKDVIDIAHHYFSFLKLSPAQTKIVAGDARLQLQKALDSKPLQQYDLLVIDAFSGDNIPFHLLTQEALQLYKQLLTPNGIIAFHTSNTYIDLMPVTKGLAAASGCNVTWIESQAVPEKRQFNATWALWTCNSAFEPWLVQQTGFNINLTPVKPVMWTDDFNSILPLLKWR